MRKKKTYDQILDKLRELQKAHPTYSFGKHISIAFFDYGDIWGLTDKEVLFALERYETELELDGDRIASPEYIEKLMKDVEDFDNILNEEDDEE